MVTQMTEMTATEAKNRFGELVEMARSEPVAITKNGRPSVYVVSAEQFDELRERASAQKVRPAIEQLMQRSVKRRRSLYEALAK
jgi:prevent-host-death family protein